MSDLTIEMCWEPVETSDGSRYLFPESPSKLIRGKWKCPAIYRWRIVTGENVEIYIGETEQLVRRLRNYIQGHNRQKTSRRIHLHLHAAVKSGATVSLEVLR